MFYMIKILNCRQFGSSLCAAGGIVIHGASQLKCIWHAAVPIHPKLNVETRPLAKIHLPTIPALRQHNHFFFVTVRVFVLAGLCVVLAGCFSINRDASTPVNVRIPLVITPTTLVGDTPIPPPSSAARIESAYTPPALPPGLRDELPVMSGICFESAYDAAGRVFVLRNADDHIRLYNLADQSGLCRQPVARYPFDFSSGRVLAGLWTRGNGCAARHEVTAYQRDDAAKTLTLTLRFIPEGDCPYELVRAFWVSFPDATDYEINIEVN